MYYGIENLRLKFYLLRFCKCLSAWFARRFDLSMLWRRRNCETSVAVNKYCDNNLVFAHQELAELCKEVSVRKKHHYINTLLNLPVIMHLPLIHTT